MVVFRLGAVPQVERLYEEEQVRPGTPNVLLDFFEEVHVGKKLAPLSLQLFIDGTNVRIVLELFVFKQLRSSRCAFSLTSDALETHVLVVFVSDREVLVKDLHHVSLFHVLKLVMLQVHLLHECEVFDELLSPHLVALDAALHFFGPLGRFRTVKTKEYAPADGSQRVRQLLLLGDAFDFMVVLLEPQGILFLEERYAIKKVRSELLEIDELAV